MSRQPDERPRRGGPGEWLIPDHALEASRAASRAPPPKLGPVTAEEIDGGSLAELLRTPGPVLVLDGDEARQAWNALEADMKVGTNSATVTAMAVRHMRGMREPGGLLLLDSIGGGLKPETLLGADMEGIRVGILADPGTELSEAAAAKCRVVRILPSPTPAP